VIPHRVKLKGFLCYKEEQEVSFDGNATLWMLSGLNGSGKSSIFDAVTYALFGHHRGGGKEAVELINKDSDSLLVEFDFLLEGKGYRAKRTLRRNTRGGATGTQQMFHLDPEGGTWTPIEDTGQKRAFDSWVADKIGLTYETFTSSVLLLQGKADKLLDSRPEGRREVLASIVDLERYERLHKLADDQRKEREGSLKTLSQRLAVLPVVTDDELGTAQDGIAVATEKRDAARDEVRRLQALEIQCGAWIKLQAKLAEARERYRQAETLLADADAIEKAVERLRDLRDWLPQLRDVQFQRGRAHQAQLELDRLGRQGQDLNTEVERCYHGLQQARHKRAALQQLIADDEARQRQVDSQLRELLEQVGKLREFGRHEADLACVREELRDLPPDCAAQVQSARDRVKALEALAGVVPQLRRFRARREDLRQAVAREHAGHTAEQEVLERGKRLRIETERLKPLWESAKTAMETAATGAAEARTLWNQARESLREVTNLDGAKVCRHCGQTLTPGHIREEKIRRKAAVNEAEKKHKQAHAALEQARANEEATRTDYDRAEQARLEARVAYEQCKERLANACQDVSRWQADCSQFHAELPPEFRTRISTAAVSDWVPTTYPDAEELARLGAEVEGLAAARHTLHQAEKVHEQWGKLKVREEGALAHLERLRAELPADHQGVRQRHAQLEAEDSALQKNLKTRRDDLKGVDNEVDRLGDLHDRAQARKVDLDSEVKQQEVQREHALQTIARVTKNLPERWRAAGEHVSASHVSEWDAELKSLQRAGTEERGLELARARLNRDVLHRDCEDLDQQQETFAEEARQDPATVGARLEDAEKAERLCDDELGAARQKLAQLEGYRKQREELGADLLAAERELEADKLLADLLGRDRLQLFLVRQAERQVVEYGNAVLDRLSGGQLYLKLSDEGSSDKALDLEAYNRLSGEKPINVAFLSGSQKFRVAVSLALGIGQYASRQHRPIESVIIDEGFGCLDSQGRQVMIQELQNLRGQMRCILLVSHQEEFADAFPDGYHFHLDGGATRVRRFQR
jgi:DNA repair exonuclease SbcCD ATPase subunit